MVASRSALVSEVSSVKFLTWDYTSLITIQSAHVRDLLVPSCEPDRVPAHHLSCQNNRLELLHLPGVVWGAGTWARVSPTPAKQISGSIQQLQLGGSGPLVALQSPAALRKAVADLGDC